MEANTREGGMTDRWDEAAERLEQELDGQDSPAACRAAFADELRSAFKAGQEDMRARAADAVGPQDKMPCVCISQEDGRWQQACDCDPRCNAAWAQEWCTQMNAAAIARSLPLKES